MLVLLGVTLVRVLAMLHYASQRRVYPGFRTLMLAAVLVFAGMAVLLLRAKLGDTVLLVFLSNAILLVPSVLVYHGLGEYGRMPHLRARTLQNVYFVVFVCLVQIVDVVFDPNMVRRVVIFSLAGFFLALRIGLELPWRSPRRLPGLKIMCFSYLITAGLQVLRGFNALTVSGFTILTMGQGDVLGVYSVFYRIFQSALELYVVFAMNSAMLEDDLQVATSRIERMAQTDALTSVLNRRGLELLGGEALKKSQRQGQSASVIMLDLDHFKDVNDSLGHDAGDELLRDVAALCQAGLREGDVFARFGGEEFVIVAPGTDADEALRLAERTRQAIEDARFAATRGALVTASFGVASARAESLEALLKSADSAMYQAKQDGRNRVALAAPADIATGMA
jgi:diguanylate cyclase (GGDEF)-like protein